MNVVKIFNASPLDLTLYNDVLTKLYSSYNHTDTRYDLIKTVDQLNIVQEHKCLVAAQFQGVAYILFFCILNIKGLNKKMNILIPKKDLKDTLEKNNLKEIKIYNIFIPFVNEEYYINGAIVDGKLTKATCTSNNIHPSFVIHEFYYKNYSDMDIEEKYQKIKSFILPKMSKIEKCKFVVSKLYEQDNLHDLLSKLDKTKYIVVGLMFLFRKTRQYYVYTNEKEFEMLKEGKKISKVTISQSTHEFIMKPTKNSDVYEIFDFNNNAIGLAGIPDIKTAHYYRNVFKEESSIKASFLYSEKFKKWIPLVHDCYDHVIPILD